MASSTPSASLSSLPPTPSTPSGKAVVTPGSSSTGPDPILRNALRYTISPREYAALHKYILSKSRALRRAAPTPSSVDKALQPRKGRDDYNAKAVRHALRVFTATWIGMKAWDAIMRRLGNKESSGSGKKKPFYKSPALRLSLSLSTILFLYRVLFRFLTRLRAHLLDPQAEPFRLRNPRTTATLTSPFAPAIGASLAGLALGIYPSKQMRVSIAIYALFRALEFGWNVCEKDGLIWGVRNGKNRERPWWFGSWMLQPFAFGQLFHAAVFDPDCFPSSFGDLIFKNSSTYLPPRPENYPTNLKWPSPSQILENIAEMARLNWPPFISPILFPNKEVLPPTLTGISPLSSQAHPLITSLSCATLHPSDPSCLRTYLTFWLDSFPSMTRFFLILYSALTIVPRFRNLYNFPFATIQRIISQALRLSTFATGALSTAWASLCFFQQYLPRHVLAAQRVFLGGFLAGMWAWVERRHGRSVFLYTARASVDSLWKVGVKRRWWKAMRGGDVWVFVLALMVTGVVYERDAKAIREGQWRKGVSWLRGEGWKDWAVEDDGEDEDGEGKDKDE
ncbi:uncharacterized protein TRIREDRAFT_77736 [Trichoderma reesei QM6a]|uniref:Predicted protein n=2 Tax=Hypocrea jecorina TaxID=51453 RepID=G0RIN2_HYPJQ|nr:uncharacterized protein TRIREDRAFT_77736 [Trichoderma reesei QM6a]EGR49036.1 predicted protein [Trichoderma reesei QM6a]ETS02302.1 hypothetical protein M419DRAFT_109803 [Trichoderma reesei RUT C-30]